MPKHEFDMTTLRYKLSAKFPYLNRIIWSLRPIKKTGIGTFGVDKYFRLYYDDTVPWSLDEQVAVLFHEVNHLIRSHHDRGENYDGQLFNIAGDLEINDDIDNMRGLSLPVAAVRPKNFGFNNGELAESYYNQLKQQMPKITMNGDGSGEGEMEMPDGTKVKFGPAAGKCGSSSGGDPNDFEDEGEGQNGVSEVQADAIKRAVAQDIRDHYEGGGRGTIPDSLIRWANEYANPTIPWQKHLRSKIRRAVTAVSGGASDYTMSRERRRYDPDYLLPALITRKCEVAVLIDTSGSVSGPVLEKFMAETSGILKHHASEVSLIVCDAEVHSIDKVQTESMLKRVKIQGGGGTDMRVGLDAAMQQKPKPNIVICLTDGATPWPERPIGANLIVALWDPYDYAKSYPMPPGTEVIHIKE